LLSVCALVLNDGGTEDEAIAALLHDAIEDHPKEVTREAIAERFGLEVPAIVEACTDTPPDYTGGPKPPWRQRKSQHLEHVRRLGPKERRVAMADKLDNARAILRDLRQHGDGLSSRFNAGKEDQLWHLRALVDGFRQADASGYLIEDLDRVVSDIESLAGPA
jgi:(p)ppGpp synthase/HD superfamily hydrolase